MQRLRIEQLPFVAACVATLVGTTGAFGFDSDGSNVGVATRNVPSPPPNFPFSGNFMLPAPPPGIDFFCFNGGCPPIDPSQQGIRYTTKTLHHSLGGIVGDGSDDGAVLGIWHCKRDAVDATVDLKKCWSPVANKDELMPGSIGWFQVRRTWGQRANADTAYGKTDHAPEHLMILQKAASVAGFDAIPLLSQRFWVRYPVDNHYLVSPIQADPLDLPLPAGLSDYVVGQSWLPVNLRDMGALAVRGVSLPELAQLPDISHTLWDWAGGNEQCPIDGLQENGFSAFGHPTYDLNACHAYKRVMGAVNASHFLPSAKAFYTHYHHLAMDRMGKCSALAQLIAPFYVDHAPSFDYFFSLGFFPRYASPNNTEAHECEREAMAYEMIAQHYLQDAWSTGHMWKRWGKSNLDEFPSILGYGSSAIVLGKNLTSPDDVKSPPEQNVAARRFLIAGMTAIYSGFIHGTKGVGADVWRELTQKLGAPAPPAWFDDPLCGPSYFFPPTGTVQDVQWRMPGGSPTVGLGDLFWAPNNGSAPSLSTKKKYEVQRNRLLGCSAASLREVYQAGPHAHGELAAWNTNAVPEYLDGPSSDGCWNQRVTNDSMLGATGPLNMRRDWSEDPGTSGPSRDNWTNRSFALANKIAFTNVFGSATLAEPIDGEKFKKTLSTRTQVDAIHVENSLLFNALTPRNPKGTESANLVTADLFQTPITYLTMGANAAPTVGPPWDVLPAPYSDRLTPREPEPQVAGAKLTYPQDHYVARMFWRSHLDELCNDPKLVIDLRDRCVNAASSGGDPDACTACVDVAEAFIPPFSNSIIALDKSKCELLTGGRANVDEWYSFQSRVNSPNAYASSSAFPPYFLAFTYCTDTAVDYSGTAIAAAATKDTSPSIIIGKDPCFVADPYLGDSDHPPYLAFRRHGVLHSELPAFIPPGGIALAPGPIVSAFDVVHQVDRVQLGSGICIYREITNRDPATQEYLDGMPQWNNFSVGNPARVAGLFSQPPIFFCGLTQRADWFNRSCDESIGFAVGAGSPPVPAIDSSKKKPENKGDYLAASGFQWQETAGPPLTGPEEMRCSIREQREVRESCPVGVCSADGLCVGGTFSGGQVQPAAPPKLVTPDKLW